ncbi:hypothetical protein LTS18_007923 [Coniosporium uncinatum]|uniref:Uncharacterized protein n=1 Tax=Coniosporium uncinatum TaxID=93489 RepID=A0ACC3DAN4_9PEZI|nr:hypothetical protein LTS18_007923 [Coniosporium uncinatum]
MDQSLRHRRKSRSNTVTTYHAPEQPNWQPGAEPGIDTTQASELVSPRLEALKALCDITIVDFSDGDIVSFKASNDTLAEILEEPRSEGTACRWISVNGLSWDVIKIIGNKYGLHRLAVEDLINTHSRTKVDWYSDHAFIVLTLQKLVRLHQHDDGEGACDCSKPDSERGGRSSKKQKRRWWQRKKAPDSDETLPRYDDKLPQEKLDEFIRAHASTSQDSPIQPIRTLHRYESLQTPEHTAFMERHSALAEEDLVVSVEQVSIALLNNNTVISFFEHSAPDVEHPILDRLESDETVLRRSNDASLLMQAIIDAIVDLTLPVKDAYNKARKELQMRVLTRPSITTSRALHIFGEEIDMLQNLFKPIVHLVNALRDHHDPTLGLAPSPYAAGVDQPASQSGGQPGVQQPSRRHDMPLFNRHVSDINLRKRLNRSTTAANASASSVTITPLARTYLGDVLDHCITTIQALELMDASAQNLSTLIFNTVGARTNYYMMIIAVVTVFFAPLTFISGYFGMNFASGDGLAHPFSFFWLVAAPSLVGFMLLMGISMFWDSIRVFLARKGLWASRRRKPGRK